MDKDNLKILEKARYYISIYYMEKQAKLQVMRHGPWSAYHAKADEDGRNVIPTPASAADGRNWRSGHCWLCHKLLRMEIIRQGRNKANWF